MTVLLIDVLSQKGFMSHMTQKACSRRETGVQFVGKGKGKGKRSIAVRKKPHRYGNSRAIWDHTVLPATRQR